MSTIVNFDRGLIASIIGTYSEPEIDGGKRIIKTRVPRDASQVGYRITSEPNHRVGTATTLASFGDDDLSS